MFYLDRFLFSEENFYLEYKEKGLKFFGGFINFSMVIVLLDFIF